MNINKINLFEVLPEEIKTEIGGFLLSKEALNFSCVNKDCRKDLFSYAMQRIFIEKQEFLENLYKQLSKIKFYPETIDRAQKMYVSSSKLNKSGTQEKVINTRESVTEFFKNLELISINNLSRDIPFYEDAQLLKNIFLQSRTNLSESLRFIGSPGTNFHRSMLTKTLDLVEKKLIFPIKLHIEIYEGPNEDLQSSIAKIFQSNISLETVTLDLCEWKAEHLLLVAESLSKNNTMQQVTLVENREEFSFNQNITNDVKKTLGSHFSVKTSITLQCPSLTITRIK